MSGKAAASDNTGFPAGGTGRRRATIRELTESTPSRVAMDVPRDRGRWSRRHRRIATGVLVALILGGLTAVLWRVDPAWPVVSADTIWIGTVEQGTFVREASGTGTLVPIERRWITAATAGRVEEILVQPGSNVAPDTVLLRLSNPDVEVQLLDARQQLADAEAELVALRSGQESSRLAQQAVIAEVRTQYLEAKHRDEMNRELQDKTPGLVPEVDLVRSGQRLSQLEDRLDIETRRLEVGGESAVEQLAAQEKQVDRLRAIVRFSEERVDSLDVRPRFPGVLAESSAEEGQWVAAGETLGRVVQPGGLKAEIRVPQSQAVGIVLGQQATVDTRGVLLEGRVSRIDPAVRDGTITVDIALPERLPGGARPNMSVFGTVVLEQLDGVTYVDRPVHASANAAVGIYRLHDDGLAERVNVVFGQISVNEVEIRAGLEPGDRVVLSDMSEWDDYPRVRIE
ncbi:MAG: HlyD family efflux transporter periplasmic adaptor subunit [Gammaproteobacteria bacterium]|nr:HlyD family efflux transporter periplasmic adaptor subunit [Gammaproteobacteria bacterium]